MLRDQRRAGLDAVRDERGQQQRGRRRKRQAQRKQRHKRRGRSRVVGRFRTRNALDRAVAKLFRMLGNLLLRRVGGERGERSGRAGDQADQETDYRTAQNRRDGAFPFFAVGIQIPDFNLFDFDIVVLRLQQRAEQFVDSKHGHGYDAELNAALEIHVAEIKPRNAEDVVHADRPQRKAEEHHQQRFERVFARKVRQDHQTENADRKVFRRFELQRKAGNIIRNERQRNQADRPRDKRAPGADCKRRARAPLLGHLVAVEAGHNAGRLAGEVDQNGRGGAAVHGPVINAGEKDQRRGRIHAEADGQQQRHCARHANSRQNARQCADQNAGHAGDHPLPGETLRKAGEQQR